MPATTIIGSCRDRPASSRNAIRTKFSPQSGARIRRHPQARSYTISEGCYGKCNIAIVALSSILLILSASGLPYVPVRGLPLFGGMLLAEAGVLNWRPIPGFWGVSATIASFALCVTLPMPSWLCALVVTLGFCFLCSGVFAGESVIARPLSYKYFRCLGNISYSFYLIHAFVVVPCVRISIVLIGTEESNIMFWTFLMPIFVASLIPSAMLFLFIEKPYSFRQSLHLKDQFAPETTRQTPSQAV